jgi:hypothetical protein
MQNISNLEVVTSRRIEFTKKKIQANLREILDILKDISFSGEKKRTAGVIENIISVLQQNFEKIKDVFKNDCIDQQQLVKIRLITQIMQNILGTSRESTEIFKELLRKFI